MRRVCWREGFHTIDSHLEQAVQKWNAPHLGFLLSTSKTYHTKSGTSKGWAPVQPKEKAWKFAWIEHPNGCLMWKPSLLLMSADRQYHTVDAQFGRCQAVHTVRKYKHVAGVRSDGRPFANNSFNSQNILRPCVPQLVPWLRCKILNTVPNFTAMTVAVYI
jgi:hypothetical protein